MLGKKFWGGGEMGWWGGGEIGRWGGGKIPHLEISILRWIEN